MKVINEMTVNENDGMYEKGPPFMIHVFLFLNKTEIGHYGRNEI